MSRSKVNSKLANPTVQQIRVSVIVPAYNAKETLAETLGSLVAQSYRDWEAIIVDDGSVDETSVIAQRFVERDNRIQLVRQRNGGEAAARNAGIREAHFEWLLFLDADDWISPAHLERMIQKIASNPGLDAVLCDHARVALDGAHVYDQYAPPEGDLFATLARRAAFPVHSCLIRTSLVEAVGGFDTSLRKSADWDLWQRIARTGAHFGHVKEVLAFYRMQPNSSSLDAQQLFEDGLRVLRQGHSRDARVRNPHPDHIDGLPTDEIHCQQFYLLCWCAGLLLGSGKDARPLLKLVGDDNCPHLYADAIAKCIFDASPLPECQAPAAWEELWGRIKHRTEEFLIALEKRSTTPCLASQALTDLKRMILRQSPSWKPLIDEYEKTIAEQLSQIENGEETRSRIEEERRAAMQLANGHEQSLAAQQRQIEQGKHDFAAFEIELDRWRNTAAEHEQSVAERQDVIERMERAQAEMSLELAKWQRTAAEHEQAIAERQDVIERVERSQTELRLELERWQRTAAEHEQKIADQQGTIEQMVRSQAEVTSALETSKHVVADQQQRIESQRATLSECSDREIRLQAIRSELNERVDRLSAENNKLLHSPERRAGDLMLNRLHMRRPLEFVSSRSAAVRQSWIVKRLAAESRLPGVGSQIRIMSSVCSTFPIYSQTFVHQELNQLVLRGFAVRIVYSEFGARDHLQSQFSRLWRLRRRLFINHRTHEKEFSRYQRRMPDKVTTLIGKLCEASGLSREALMSHANFLQAFSFTRMVEAYRPQYLHTYFFYDRSLMALVAGYLLDIPRGVSCYADHQLQDYELKVVPLHLELCDIVVATSQRIKQELVALAPNCDVSRILVKPNGIDSERFPVVERAEPAEGTPFRIVTVCRIDPKKGLIELVEAVDQLRRRGLHVEAHIVGTFDEWSDVGRAYKQKLDQRISELGLWGTVHLEGRQNLEGILRFLRIAQLFVAPFVEAESGDKDGVPTALLEAMATALPIVATDAGSITEVIDDGRDGFLVPQRDTVALADAIEAMLKAPDQRDQMGHCAAKKVRESFDVANCEAIFHQRITDLVASKRL